MIKINRFTLIEVTMALGVMAIGLVSVMSVFPIVMMQADGLIDKQNETAAVRSVSSLFQKFGLPDNIADQIDKANDSAGKTKLEEMPLGTFLTDSLAADWAEYTSTNEAMDLKNKVFILMKARDSYGNDLTYEDKLGANIPLYHSYKVRECYSGEFMLMKVVFRYGATVGSTLVIQRK